MSSIHFNGANVENPNLTPKELQALSFLDKSADGMLAKSIGLKLRHKPRMRQQVGSFTANKLVAYGFAGHVKNRFVITDEGRKYLSSHPLPSTPEKPSRRGKRGSRPRRDMSPNNLVLAKDLIRLIREIKWLLEKV